MRRRVPELVGWDNSVVYLHQVLTSSSITMSNILEQRQMRDIQGSKRSCLAWSRMEGSGDEQLVFPSILWVLDSMLQNIRNVPSYNPQNQSCKHWFKISECFKLDIENGEGDVDFLLSTLCGILNFQLYVFYFHYNQVWFTLSSVLHKRKSRLNNSSKCSFCKVTRLENHGTSTHLWKQYNFWQRSLRGGRKRSSRSPFLGPVFTK